MDCLCNQRKIIAHPKALGACKDRVDKDEAPRQANEKKGPAQISVENGQTVLTLDLPTQGRLGLEVVTLTPTVTRAQITSPAVVLSAQDLATFRTSYFAAQAQLQKSRIEGGVARKEYARLKSQIGRASCRERV